MSFCRSLDAAFVQLSCFKVILTNFFDLSGYFKAFFRIFDVEDAADPVKLAACCPKGMDPRLAMQEAQGAIQDYRVALYERATCDWGGPKEDKEDSSD